MSHCYIGFIFTIKMEKVMIMCKTGVINSIFGAMLELFGLMRNIFGVKRNLFGLMRNIFIIIKINFGVILPQIGDLIGLIASSCDRHDYEQKIPAISAFKSAL